MGDSLIDWVKKQLQVKNISQRELARRAGVSHTLISDALRGARPVTFEFCLAVSKGLKEPIWNTLSMAGFVDDVPQELSDSEEIRVLIAKYNSLSGENKQELSNYLDWLILKQQG